MSNMFPFCNILDAICVIIFFQVINALLERVFNVVLNDVMTLFQKIFSNNHFSNVSISVFYSFCFYIWQIVALLLV